MDKDIYYLTEEEKKEVNELSKRVVERIHQIRTKEILKDLLTVVDKLTKVD